MSIDIIEVLKTLSDSTRLRILVLLTRGELCVCDITDVLNLPQSTVSRHMSRLKLTGLVADKRKGKWVYYQLNKYHNESMIKVFELIDLQLVNEPFASDQRVLESHDVCEKC